MVEKRKIMIPTGNPHHFLSHRRILDRFLFHHDLSGCFSTSVSSYSKTILGGSKGNSFGSFDSVFTGGFRLGSGSGVSTDATGSDSGSDSDSDAGGGVPVFSSGSEGISGLGSGGVIGVSGFGWESEGSALESSFEVEDTDGGISGSGSGLGVSTGVTGSGFGFSVGGVDSDILFLQARRSQ